MHSHADLSFRPANDGAFAAMSGRSADFSRRDRWQRDKVEAMVDVLGKICDAAMSSDPRFPSKIAVSMGTL